MIFDLGDSSKWEYMLPSNDKPILKVPNLIDANDDDEEDPKEIEKHLDLPPSWVKPIEITPKGLQLFFLSIYYLNSTINQTLYKFNRIRKTMSRG